MGYQYRIHGERAYFLTMTVVDWIDVFTRKNHKLKVVESLRYCQEKKGLKIYAWCLMPSHLHLIASADEPNNLSDIIRDFKKFTARRIVNQIKEEPESRREWLLDKLAYNGRIAPDNETYKLWQSGNHPVELYSPEFTKQKLNYIHNNPVEELYVVNSWDYYFSSARNYADLDGLLDVILIDRTLNRAY